MVTIPSNRLRTKARGRETGKEAMNLGATRSHLPSSSSSSFFSESPFLTRTQDFAWFAHVAAAHSPACRPRISRPGAKSLRIKVSMLHDKSPPINRGRRYISAFLRSQTSLIIRRSEGASSVKIQKYCSDAPYLHLLFLPLCTL